VADRDEAGICEQHVGWLREVASAMGLPLQVTPLSVLLDRALDLLEVWDTWYREVPGDGSGAEAPMERGRALLLEAGRSAIPAGGGT
jgi:hypothetical protein